MFLRLQAGHVATDYTSHTVEGSLKPLLGIGRLPDLMWAL